MESFGNYINGEFVESKSGKTFPNVNPANFDEVVGTFQSSNEADVADACAAAVAAQKDWAATPATKRGEYLFKAADLLAAKLTQLGTDMTREEGKTLPEAKGEVRRSINIFRYFAGEGSRCRSASAAQRPERATCSVGFTHAFAAASCSARSSRQP